MNKNKRQILVTSALPYANGAMHLGHMLEYIQTDIWARFQRAQGHECYFAWADDAHGTPVMLWARAEGKPPEELIDMMNEQHKTDFRDFGISFDNYTSTHSDYNREIVEQIYNNLEAGGFIDRRNIEQLYDEQEGMFLSDRFVKGTCPKCKSVDQYGDNCDKCGASYAATDLLEPISTISGLPPNEIVAQGICQVPEGRRIFPYLTVSENLDMGAFLRTDKEGIKADSCILFGITT